MRRRLHSALVASAIFLIHSGVGGVAPAQETGQLDRALARSLPDVSGWLSQLQARFAVKPMLARASAARAARTSDALPASGRDATWLAVGLTRTNEWSELAASRNYTTIPLDFSVPATLDITLDQYADSTRESDQRLRFADVGAMLSIPLAGNPARFGRWTFSAGAHLRLFDFELRSGNGGDAAQWIGCAGFSLSF